MRYAVATEFEDMRAFFAGAPITIEARPDGGVIIALDLAKESGGASPFETRAAAAQFAVNMTELCGMLPGHARTWFVVELPEPRP